MSIKTVAVKVGRTVAKHSPAIFTGVGVVGLGATAYLAYKSRSKVEAVVERIEEDRDNNIEINKFEVAKDIAEAVYLPVTVGVLSVAAILMSHKIQRDRILTLSGALAAQQARNLYFENKYRKVHGEDEYKKFITPTEQQEVETTDKKGNTKMVVQEVKKEVDQTIGQWYDESSEYVSDDHTYNMAYIESVNDRMQTLLFQRGTLLLNEVREALGFERIRAGALLGWTTMDSFEIEKTVNNMRDLDENGLETGDFKEHIYVTWSKPRYIYDDMEFNGRYSIY